MLLRVTRILLVLLLSSGSALAQVSTIAVVSEGPGSEAVTARVEASLAEVLPSGRSAVFVKDAAFDIQWDTNRARAAVQAALDDRDVDIVLINGFLGMDAAMQMNLTKPVISAFATRLDAFQLADMENDRSTKNNLSFTLIPQRIQSDIAAFLELRHFDTAHVLIGQEYMDGLDLLRPELDRLQQALDVRFEFLAVSADTAAAFAALPADVEAVLLSYTPRLSVDERRAHIAGFTQRDIPTFSLVGYSDVEIGALAARTPDVTEQVVRRTAVNLSEIMRGRPTGELPVVLSVATGIFINGPTGAAVDYYPSMSTLAFARFLDGEALALKREPLTLQAAMQMVEEGNPELQVSTERANVAQYEKDVAKSGLWPQINFDPAYTANPNALGGLDGIIPKQSVSIGGNLRQMIYDDRTVADYKASARQWEGAKQMRESDRLDAVNAAAEAYLQLGLSKALFNILQDNLRLTEENLDLAHLRADVGYSGRDEVFRWEAELAMRRSELFAGLSGLEVRNLNLNRILGLPQLNRWDLEQTDLQGDRFPFLDGELSNIMEDSRDWHAFREKMVEFATQQSPELASLRLMMESQQIQLNQRQRRWWLPSFGVEAGYHYMAWRDPEIDAPREIPFVQVRANYAILEGGGKMAEIRRVRSEFRQTEEQTDLVHQLLEERVRTSIREMESSFPAIRFNRIQAENAARNLDLVQDKYSQGLVNVTDLLEAQNASLAASQSSVAAVYDFLIDLIRFQRSIGWFELEQTTAEKDELLQMVQEALASR